MRHFFVRGATRLASPKLSVVFFASMAAGSLAVTELAWPATWAVLPPLFLLGLNLCAAVVTQPRFRSDFPLLVFHLALLALVLLFALARLTYFEARTNLIANTAFDGDLRGIEQGPLHGGGISSLRFANEGVSEDRVGYGKYVATDNRVRWWDARGVERVSEIGDDRPLVLEGYRIYTTRNRGFAPVFAWQPTGGPVEYGGVQLRDMGQGGFTPDAGWQLPKGPDIWAMIEPLATPGQNASGADPGADQRDRRLVVRIGETRYPLRAGESIELAAGRLTYVELRSWMGYRISYDPIAPWLLATLGVGIGSLIWIYARQFLRHRRPLAPPHGWLGKELQ